MLPAKNTCVFCEFVVYSMLDVSFSLTASAIVLLSPSRVVNGENEGVTKRMPFKKTAGDSASRLFIRLADGIGVRQS